jgi:hypothetical protein
MDMQLGKETILLSGQRPLDFTVLRIAHPPPEHNGRIGRHDGRGRPLRRRGFLKLSLARLQGLQLNHDPSPWCFSFSLDALQKHST